MTNTTKSFAEELKAIREAAIAKSKEEELKAVTEWVENTVKPACVEAAKNLKNAKSFKIPRELNLQMLREMLRNKKNNLTISYTNDCETLVVYW